MTRLTAVLLIACFALACTTRGNLIWNTMGKASITVCKGDLLTDAETGDTICSGEATVQKSDHIGPEFSKMMAPLVAAFSWIGMQLLPPAVVPTKPPAVAPASVLTQPAEEPAE